MKGTIGATTFVSAKLLPLALSQADLPTEAPADHVGFPLRGKNGLSPRDVTEPVCAITDLKPADTAGRGSLRTDILGGFRLCTVLAKLQGCPLGGASKLTAR